MASSQTPIPNQINGPGSAFYDADMRQIEQPFDDAYVEFIGPRSGMGAVPYLPPAFFDGFQLSGACRQGQVTQIPGYDFTPWWRFGWLWFQNHGLPNYVWLCGTGTTAQLGTCTITCTSGTVHPNPQIFGLTSPSSAESFVFAGAVETYCPDPTQEANAVGDATSHEEGHEFYVNPTSSSWGHCTRCGWPNDGPLACSVAPTTCSDDTTACLMNESRDRWTYQHRFDRFELMCGDSGCPNGDPGCCAAGESGCWLPGNGSIRQLIDPIEGVAP